MFSPARLVTLLLLLPIGLASGCGAPDSARDLSAEEAPGVVQDVRTEPEVVIGSPCKNVADCDPISPCVPSVQCLDGGCEYTLAISGQPCAEGCFENGVCDGDGACANLFPKECPETDGNICTAPSCDVATGECFENVIADGLPPYISSDCLEGAVCIDGEQDNEDALPSELSLECEAMGDELDPFDCIDMYICVGGEDPCKPIFKVDGTQCWTGDSEGCAGHSCAGGNCVVDNGYDIECGADDYPAQCTGGCLDCTDLACAWIPDPANPDSPTKQVRYCKPEAKVGFACGVDECLLGQVCSLGSPANGPLGKETLGACTGGLEKSKEQCLEELGKPALECLLAGVDCDPELGGCLLQQEISDKWCWPPEWKCFDKNDTYCTHLDSGDDWNPENGCHTAWVDLNCEDNNDCTVDLCKVDADQWKCEHQPIDGAGCDDGDPCTTGGMCVDGVCAQQEPKCSDQDEDPCNDPTCDPFTGECKPAQTNGYPCNDGNACTIGDSCQDLVCNSGDKKSCDDGNVCTDDFCDTVAGCLHDDNFSPCPGGVNYGCKGGECLCQAECGGKECGGDGCNGSCGTCGEGLDCLNGNCFCIGDCTGKKCGDDGCGGSCGSCNADQDCVAGQCEGGGGFDPNGTYSLSPAPTHTCGWGAVQFSIGALEFIDSGNSLFIGPAVNGCCSLQGDSAKDGSFTASCQCPGGGVCDENYSLTGTFSNDNQWSGTFSAQYVGQLCLGCTFYSTTVTGSK